MSLSLSRVPVVLSVLLPLAAGVALAAHAAGKVPASIARLLPESAVLKNDDWGVFETEFGKTFSGGMHTQFPGFPVTCDNTVGPEMRVTIKGDTAWEEPPMLDMAIEAQAEEIRQAHASLPTSVRNMLKTNSGVRSIGPLQEKKLPTGHLVYIEFKEDCARHPGGSATVLRGFARKGATTLAIELVLTKSAAEAQSMVSGMFTRFQQLDTAALARSN